MQSNGNGDNKNIIVGTDYGQLSRIHTNGAIVEVFISLLFSNKKFNGETIIVMLRNMAILLLIKILLEDSKTYLDKFKFSDLTIIKYIYQRLCYLTTQYEIIMVGNKWMYKK